jgi:hypothetical protein
MTMVEEHLGNTLIGIPCVNSRLGRLSERVERVEHRLHLADYR